MSLAIDRFDVVRSAAGVLVSGGAGLLAVLEGRLTGWRAPEAPTAAISTSR